MENKDFSHNRDVKNVREALSEPSVQQAQKQVRKELNNMDKDFSFMTNKNDNETLTEEELEEYLNDYYVL